MADPKDTETTGTGAAYEATVKVEETVRQPVEQEPTTTTTEQSTETTEPAEDE